MKNTTFSISAKFSILVLLVSLGLNSNGQINDTTGFHNKKKELESAKVMLKNAEAAVSKLQSEVNALKPIVKWTNGGFQSVNFNQVSLTNWSKGGQNSFSVTALGNLFANYKYNSWTWENNLNVAYGLIRNAGEDFRKNEDKIDFTTRIGRKATNHLSWAAGIRFESQFAPGFDDQAPDTNRPRISEFLAPAYVKASIGMDYKPTDKLTVFLSPAAGKFTIVMDQDIAERNIYIPESAADNKFRSEFGALFTVTYQDKEIFKNIGLRTYLELFNNYSDPNEPNRKNIDVDWQTSIDFKIGKYIGANLFTHLLYDNDTKFIEYNALEQPIEKGARVQFKEVFGVGFSYKF